MENEPNRSESLSLEIYKISIQTRNFEIELFWKRSLFFLGFIASAFVGFAATYRTNISLGLVFACLGVVCSFAWSLANRGSKFWYEHWEKKVFETERGLGAHVFQD